MESLPTQYYASSRTIMFPAQHEIFDSSNALRNVLPLNHPFTPTFKRNVYALKLKITICYGNLYLQVDFATLAQI